MDKLVGYVSLQREESDAVFNQTAIYAMRALAYLATMPEGSSVRSSDLSAETGVPVHYLSKIMRRMVIAKLVTSRRGHGGGFSLARPPGEITFAQLLSAVDACPSSDQCALGNRSCSDRRPCLLHAAWSRGEEAITRWTEETTLADIDGTAPGSALLGLFAPSIEE